MTHIAHDLTFGARQLRLRPGTSVLVVLCLALGIGATTAVFALFESVLVEPLPYPDAERIVMVWETPPGFLHNPVSGPNFLDWKRQSRSFAALAAVSVQSFNVAGAAQPEVLQGGRVSADYFDVFGVPPALGRVPRDDESLTRVAVISDRLWRNSFAAAPDVSGMTIRIDGEAHTVIGVMPAGFAPATRWSVGRRMDVWLPFDVPSSAEDRSNHSMEVVGRLVPGVTVRRAQLEMTAIARDLAAQYPDSNHDYGARVAALKDELVGRARTPVLLLLAAAVLVFLIVCANVAGLLIARATARGTEFALRSSLGADRRRVAVQLLTENVPLVAIGSALGLLCSRAFLDGLRALVPLQLWHVRSLSVDGSAALFCLGLSLIAAVLVGAPTTMAVPRGDASRWLRGYRGGTGGSAGRHGLRGALIVTQLAIALVLANAAALLLASFVRLAATDQGFDREGLLTARLQLVGPRYGQVGGVAAWLHELLPRVRRLPGVRDVAATTKLPLYGGNNGTEIIEGREGDFGRDGGPEVERSTVSPGYFSTMGIPLLEGRLLSESDAEAPVAVINETFARTGWPGESALGGRFRSSEQWFTVVGVVGDVRQWGPERPARPELYRLFAARPRYDSEDFLMARPYLLIRTDGDPGALTAAVAAAVREFDPDQPVSEVVPMATRVDEASKGRRFLTVLIAVLAAVAVVLVTAGIFGLMATVVAQRTHEIGVRMALGATPRGMMALVLGDSLKTAAAGLVIGLVGVAATTRVLSNQLYGTKATDPWLVGAAVLLLAAAAVVGAMAPAWRAWRVNPTVALRAE